MFFHMTPPSSNTDCSSFFSLKFQPSQPDGPGDQKKKKKGSGKLFVPV